MAERQILVESLAEIPERLPVYLAVGVFDGVHLGHQQLLRQMVAEAEAAGCVPAVLTFFPHPARVIRGATGRYYLNRPHERTTYLAELGIRLIVLQTFDDAFRQIRAADFVQLLRQHLDLRQLWGSDFSLGYQGKGDYDFLRQQGEAFDFVVRRLEIKAEVAGEPVSSSRIRQALAEGDIPLANRCLTRPFQLVGPVIKGAQRGRTLNFPTANMGIWDEQVLPATGVYACTIRDGDEVFRAATNLGYRPTVNGHNLAVEPHILDFDRNIYDEEVALSFLERIRPEMKFNGLDELKAQIGRDVAYVRQHLAL